MTLAVAEIEPSTTGAREFLATQEKRMLIGGDWVPGSEGEFFDSINPATGEVIGRVPRATTADLDNAVKAAREALNGEAWSGMTPGDRGKVLWRLGELIESHIDELAELETLDQGKPLAVGRWAEIPGAVQQFQYFAGQADKIEGSTIPTSINYQPPGKRIFAYTVKEPVGVVAAIIPWNSPLIMAAMKLAPALAAGCAVILKPAEDTSLTALRLGELALEAGLPPGVLNIVTGPGETGAYLTQHPGVDKVAFTGSTTVGQSILAGAAGNLKRVTLELGGKSPVVVMDDADLDMAIPGAANAIFFNTGQVCVAGSRLYAHRKVYDRLVEGVAEIANGIRLGHGLDPDTQMGPLVSSKQASRVCGYIETGEQDGARTLTGGGPLGDSQCFVKPTVIVDVAQDMRIVQEEVFGPVVVCTRFDDVAEVPGLANDSHYGLAASVWTQDLSAAHNLASAIRAGTVWINSHLMFDASLPIGGMKASGWGRESGHQAVDNYLELKTVCAVL